MFLGYTLRELSIFLECPLRESWVNDPAREAKLQNENC